MTGPQMQGRLRTLALSTRKERSVNMPCIGNIVNTVGVLIAACIGLMLKRGVPQKVQQVLMQALGMCTIFIGVSGTLQNMLSVDGGKLQVNGTMLLIVSMVVGTVIGELIDIEALLDRLGERLRNMAGSKGGSQFTEAFVTCSLIICVGAMAVVGGITDGLGDPSTLFAKTALDFVVILIFSSTMGIGAMFSALPMFLYQGIFNLIGLLAGNVMPETMLTGLSLVGNVLIFGVGVNLAFGKRIRVGNMLPALLVPVIWELVRGLLG